MPTSPIKHVFLLMLENHSFDHVFGFSNIPGINGLTGNESNDYLGKTYKVNSNAPDRMPSDPGHEFKDTVEQLCGEGAKYHPGQYPTINNSGFVYNYATSKTESTIAAPAPPPINDIGDIMSCFNTAKKLPIIYQLAIEFAVCDNWFSSLPGPTWPNRFFAYAASSAGLDDSPTTDQLAQWEIFKGVRFNNGSIFSKLNKNFKLYQDGLFRASFPIVLGLEGIHYSDISDFADFENDLNNSYNAAFTLIEPNYGDFELGTYGGGSSQHPMDGMSRGEQLIKDTYKAIRKSQIWDSSLLIITYDEHGGFYDSVIPPKCIAPGDGTYTPGKNLFDFTQLGVRVPAVIVSPFIPKNTVSHEVYDHTSILATVENLNNLAPLTNRDKNANTLLSLLSLNKPRTDCPLKLSKPVKSPTPITTALMEATKPFDENALLPESGNLIGFLQIAMKTDYELSEKTPALEKTITGNMNLLKTRGDVKNYIQRISSQAKKMKNKNK